MDRDTIFAMIAGLAIVMPIVYILIEKIDQRDKAKNNIGVTLYLKKARSNPIYGIYHFLSVFPLSKGYFEKISRRYEMLCPGYPKRIANKTMFLAATTFFLCLIEVVFVYVLEPNMVNFVLAIYLIFIINNEVINYFVSAAEINLLNELERFLSNVSHNYFINYYIDDAIADAIDHRMSEEMKIHAKMIYDIITSNTKKEEVERYNTTTHNKYLKMFLSLCISVVENGDKSINRQRLMTANLINLRKEINLELLKQKQLRFVFSGSIFACVVVCIPITMIQQFGISIVPNLEQFYKGQLSILFIGLIFLTSAIVYVLINNAKEIKKPMIKSYAFLEALEKKQIIKEALNNFTEKNYGRMILVRDTLKRLGEIITPKQLLLKSMLASIITFLLCIILVLYLHQNSKQLLTENINNLEGMTSTATVQQLEDMKEQIKKYVALYLDEEVTKEEIKQQITAAGEVHNEAVQMEIAKQVTKRINKYQSEYFKWYELILCFFIAILAFFIPYLMVLYRRKLLVNVMEDEVIQFNSIIYMMMYSDHVTVMDLLEQMELFAVVFKPTLRECMNEYNSGDMEALAKMKEREKYEPFLRLVDNLIRCDDMTIENAFDEIASDRENYHDRRKQENEIAIQKRADNIKPLAFLPGVLVLIYLIVPILYMSIKELVGLREMIQSLSGY